MNTILLNYRCLRYSIYILIAWRPQNFQDRVVKNLSLYSYRYAYPAGILELGLTICLSKLTFYQYGNISFDRIILNSSN